MADECGNAACGISIVILGVQEIGAGAVLNDSGVRGTYKGWKTSSQERGWATAATTTDMACAQQRASVVKVHVVVEMRYIVTVAFAILS
ncbi:hypothetical protein J3R82DRAFT_8196 [Butyriboletus roseoflavus]|nr:hypothetical protein J3R82DRAFT_8196 [Butyriboletus roseoflavus]